MRPALRLLLVAAVLGPGALAACSEDSKRSTPGAGSPPPGAIRYVALGDSYTSAPGIPQTSTDGCFQSSNNYPHLVAAAVDAIDLIDVSCGGATTTTLLEGQDTPDGNKPPQVDAVTDETDLVTIGIGGNDNGLTDALFGICLQVAATDPTGPPCRAATTAQASSAVSQIEDLVGSVLDAVVEAAPDARVVVVSYPKLLPTSGATCPDLVSFATGDYAYVDEVVRQLNGAVRRAANSHGATYADLYTASEGHDICSDEPWINGLALAADGTFPLHPLLAGQEAVAKLVEDFVD